MAAICLAVIIAIAIVVARMAAFIAEHESLAANGTKRLESPLIGIPPHLDFVLAVRTPLRDDVCPIFLILRILKGKLPAFDMPRNARGVLRMFHPVNYPRLKSRASTLTGISFPT